MLTNQQKASIHIAKAKRGMSDPDYRALLAELDGLTGVKSSTDQRLGDKEYQAIMKAINGTVASGSSCRRSQRSERAISRDRRIGWQYKQLRKFRQYCKYCGMDETEAREIIFRNFGVMHEEAPTLTNADFDDIMVILEELLEERISSGSLPGFIRVDKSLDLHYWRRRRPGKGAVNTRESHKILEVWNELKGYLPVEKQNDQYLLGFAAHTCRLSRAKAINDLKASEALKVIDALKKRLIQERGRSVGIDAQKDEPADVPF